MQDNDTHGNGGNNNISIFFLKITADSKMNLSFLGKLYLLCPTGRQLGLQDLQTCAVFPEPHPPHYRAVIGSVL